MPSPSPPARGGGVATGGRVFFRRVGGGWGTIYALAELLARCFGAETTYFERAPRHRALAGRLLRPMLHARGHVDFYIARYPADLPALLRLADARRTATRVLWVVDSFLTEQFARPADLDRFDVVGYMQHDEAPFYEAHAGDRALFLGWGADALDLGGDAPDRPVDVLRVGRQPPAWDDDAATAAACARHGLRFAGRPQGDPDPRRQHALAMRAYMQTKVVIAHSNLAAPAGYTHATKEYITGRWTDALACGALPAGVQPRGDGSMAALLWDGATIDFDRIDLEANLAQLRDRLAGWSPADARRTHHQALKRLDWRWRIKAIADRLGVSPQGLGAELDRLRARIAATAPPAERAPERAAERIAAPHAAGPPDDPGARRPAG